jgi:hypothetical protein
MSAFDDEEEDREYFSETSGSHGGGNTLLVLTTLSQLLLRIFIECGNRDQQSNCDIQVTVSHVILGALFRFELCLLLYNSVLSKTINLC